MRPGSVGSGAGTAGSDVVQYKGPVSVRLIDPFFMFVATIDIRLL